MTTSAKTGAEPRGPAERMLGAVYDGASGAFALLARPLALLGGPRWRQKLGLYAARGDRPRCWIHACSVGEVRVALRCMEALRRASPGLCFTLSTVTPEGLAAARSGVLDPRDEAVLFPLDARSAMRRAFDRLAPDFVILTEAELWPNHLQEAATRRVPVFVINGRLTAADERNYRKAGRFMRRAFAIPELVCARGPVEAERFRNLGARDIVVTGDLKYETVLPADGATGTRCGNVLLGASTHAGEEKILLRAMKHLRGAHPGLRLVLVPRHPRRADLVARLAEREGFRAGLASRGEQDREVLVVDGIGQLPEWYARATVCFVGKSLIGGGGQNFLEAAAAGCPVVTGRHLENFAEAADLFLAARAMAQVRDGTELAETLRHLLRDPKERQRMATAARGILQKNSGAAQRNAALILGRLKSGV